MHSAWISEGFPRIEANLVLPIFYTSRPIEMYFDTFLIQNGQYVSLFD